MAPEQQKDRAIGFLAVLGIAVAVLVIAGGSLAAAAVYARASIAEPVLSPEVQAFSGPTPVTPEVQAGIDAHEKASAEFDAMRERMRLENEARERGTDSSAGSD